MNDQRIVHWIDGLFSDCADTETVREQKEELRSHMTERIRDYMENGRSYDEAFHKAKADFSNMDELIGELEKKIPHIKVEDVDTSFVVDMPDVFVEHAETRRRRKRDFSGLGTKLTALSPFIYVIVGILANPFGWWAWGWMIVPVTAIVAHVDDWRSTVTALSPFVYLLTGFWFGWWAWAWLLIPVTAIAAHVD